MRSQSSRRRKKRRFPLREFLLLLVALASGAFTVKWSCDLSQDSCERVNVEVQRMLDSL